MGRTEEQHQTYPQVFGAGALLPSVEKEFSTHYELERTQNSLHLSFIKGFSTYQQA